MNAGSILIVEDDATLLRGLQDSFVAHGYEVATAADILEDPECADKLLRAMNVTNVRVVARNWSK
jgi:DNA-binding response OmpR family regulator